METHRSKPFATEKMIVEQVRTHPRKREALTSAEPAMLAKWAFDHPPRLCATVQTPHFHLNAIAISSNGEMIAVAPASKQIEFRRWDDLSLLPDLIASTSEEATSVMFSDDGRWLAMADRHETISLIDLTTGSVTAEVEGGEQTFALRFNPASTILASACSFQGGGYIRVDRIGTEGQLLPLYELSRSDYSTQPGAFIDSLNHLAFSPDGQWLALFESSAIYHDQRPPGWRGNIVLYAVETGALQWQASIDEQVTGDRRSLREIGSPMGFFTELLFVNQTEIVCGASHGLVLFYDVAIGKPTRSIDLHTDASIRSLSLEKDGAILWCVLGDGQLATVAS